MFDLIGDIHGHADELIQLLQILGYPRKNGVHEHPERRVIFLGDFIDRGPQIQQVLDIVRPMVESGKAHAVMGNHEFNALAFHTEHRDRKGVFLRDHEAKNFRQHAETINQLSDKKILADALRWFGTLPMWLDLAGLRVIHACWDEKAIATIQAARPQGEPISSDFLHAACDRGGDLFNAVEIALKGKEVNLPKGQFFNDKDSEPRYAIRARWYLSPEGQTYRSYALQSDEIPVDLPLDQAVSTSAAPYPATAKPVFIGHYWLEADRPKVLTTNVACVDYSVAKGGFLCAYRWHGEQKLDDNNFVRAAKLTRK